jgi:two-component system, NarL family, sensor histidine kinase LiaS
MSSGSDKRFRSVRWSLLLAFVRASAAALAVFLGLGWGMLSLWRTLAAPELSLDLLTDSQWHVVLLLLVLAALVSIALVGGTMGFLESRTYRSRMRTLTEATMMWANGRLGHRIVELGTDDEVAVLADTLNGMAERLEEQVIALQRLLEKNEQLHQQAAHAAALEERSRLARDLHDSVSQQLFAMGMTAGAVNKLYAIDPQRAHPLLLQLEEMAAKAQAEMRALLLHLRPIELEGRSLAEALERFLHDVCPRHNLLYDFEIDERLGLGEGIEGQLFRICQEAVSNVIRHASARRLLVRLVAEGNQVLLSIRDDGNGFEAATVRDGSYGMHSLRERAEEIGGRLEVRTAQGAGTEVCVLVSRIAMGEE